MGTVIQFEIGNYKLISMEALFVNLWDTITPVTGLSTTVVIHTLHGVASTSLSVLSAADNPRIYQKL